MIQGQLLRSTSGLCV